MAHPHCRLTSVCARLVACALALLSPCLAGGCAQSLEPLMPTPALFTETGVDPTAHIPEDERWVPRRVFYATTRERTNTRRDIAYGNKQADMLSMGMALIGFGPPEMTWADLQAETTSPDRKGHPPLTINGLFEAGRFPVDATAEQAAQPHHAGWVLNSIDAAVGKARDKDILLYVHGAKVDFYNACAFAAQLDHFMGRDLTSVAFAWPTHQNILSYGLGGDVRRAYHAAPALATLLEVLAADTSARRIHVLCWSAGGRVTASALAELRRRHPELDHNQLQARLRLGTVYFAAADVPADEFLEALPYVHDIAREIVVTQSDRDGALASAEKLMGGQTRIGLLHAATAGGERRAWLEDLERLHVINVSQGAGERGFDITGHRYWFNHPWASSDVVLSIRTDLNPGQRGLQGAAAAERPVVWAIPPDYPDRLRDLANQRGEAPLREWAEDARTNTPPPASRRPGARTTTQAPTRTAHPAAPSRLPTRDH